MQRHCVWARDDNEEAYHDAIECAVGSDGTSPAFEFLKALRSGTWATDPEYKPPKDGDQAHDFYMMLAKLEYIGENGTPQNRGAVNYLKSGVWEVRHYKRRLTYWDTPGDGTYTEHPKQDDHRTCDAPDSDYWWYPNMDAVLRLGVAWPKVSQTADQNLINNAIQLRDEDCAHDVRTATGTV